MQEYVIAFRDWDGALITTSIFADTDVDALRAAMERVGTRPARGGRSARLVSVTSERGSYVYNAGDSLLCNVGHAARRRR
jgi:hypothetical protein